MEKLLGLISKILLVKYVIIPLPNIGISRNLLVRYIKDMRQTDVE
jgi:hypothetical protein